MTEKLSHEEFARKAVESLRKEGYKGMHAIYSGDRSADNALKIMGLK